ncbi:MAG: hypothetical protein II585_02700, partial [Clostridiales bacterium]|nr:hypothetical protein [Clostridiales bacterium]
VARTIRLLQENGVDDIAISATDPRFNYFGVPVLSHENRFDVRADHTVDCWVSAFYPTSEPACYIMGDVVFSPRAIKTIVETPTDSIEFFASAKPLPPIYPKRWAEPFAFKVEDLRLFWESVVLAKKYDEQGLFKRQPVSWELWQVIKGTPLNKIIYTNYKVINDYTCDVDTPEDARLFERIIKR